MNIAYSLKKVAASRDEEGEFDRCNALMMHFPNCYLFPNIIVSHCNGRAIFSSRWLISMKLRRPLHHVINYIVIWRTLHCSCWLYTSHRSSFKNDMSLLKERIYHVPEKCLIKYNILSILFLINKRNLLKNYYHCDDWGQKLSFSVFFI